MEHNTGFQKPNKVNLADREKAMELLKSLYSINKSTENTEKQPSALEQNPKTP